MFLFISVIPSLGFADFNCLSDVHHMLNRSQTVSSSYYYTKNTLRSLPGTSKTSKEILFEQIHSTDDPTRRLGMILAYIDFSTGKLADQGMGARTNLGERFAHFDRLVAKNYLRGKKPKLQLFPPYLSWVDREGFRIQGRTMVIRRSNQIRLGQSIPDEDLALQNFIVELALGFRQLELSQVRSAPWINSLNGFRQETISKLNDIDPEIYRMLQLFDVNKRNFVNRRRDYGFFAGWEFILLPSGSQHYPDLSKEGWRRFLKYDEVLDQEFERAVNSRSNVRYVGNNILRSLTLTFSAVFGTGVLYNLYTNIDNIQTNVTLLRMMMNATVEEQEEKTPEQIALERAIASDQFIQLYRQRIEESSDPDDIEYYQSRIDELTERYLNSANEVQDADSSQGAD